MINKFRLSKFLLLSFTFISSTINSQVKEVGSYKELQTHLRKSAKPTAVIAHARWCGPCKRAAKPYEELSRKYQKSFNFLKIEADKNKEMQGNPCNVGSFPTFFLFPARSTTPSKKVVGDIEKFESECLANARPEEENNLAQPETVEEVAIQEEPTTAAQAIEQPEPEVKKPAKKSRGTGKVSEITSKSDFENLKNNKNLVIMAETDHCQFCKLMKNPLEQMANEYPDVNFAIADVEKKFPELEDNYGPFKGYPTFLVFKNGEFSRSFIGAGPSEEGNKFILENSLSDVIGKTSEPMVEIVERPSTRPEPMPSKQTKSKQNNKYKKRKTIMRENL